MALGEAGFALGVRPVASLRPHEEVIPRHVDELSSEMRRDGIQRDPIIIDRDSAAVLDGMHRLAAFQKLGIENAVCCSVDYSSRGVSVGRWARVYAVNDGDRFDAVVGKMKRVRLAEAFDALQRREAGVALLTSEAAFLSQGGAAMDDVVREVASFDKLAEQMDWQRSFTPEDEVDVPLQQHGRVVLLPRRLAKDDVVAASRSGRLFPCKTSMHVIDPRPVAVDFPLAELGEATSADLKKRMAGRQGRLLPAGSEYAGRRYKERLLVLDLN